MPCTAEYILQKRTHALIHVPAHNTHESADNRASIHTCQFDRKFLNSVAMNSMYNFQLLFYSRTQNYSVLKFRYCTEIRVRKSGFFDRVSDAFPPLLGLPQPVIHLLFRCLLFWRHISDKNRSINEKL